MNFHETNRTVMMDTVQRCKESNRLKCSIEDSIKRQKVYINPSFDQIRQESSSLDNVIVSGKRTFESARSYVGYKTCVLNFANNHSVGGAPFSAGAQEESLCRCSTLYQCLLAEKSSYYDYHYGMFQRGELGLEGNDDLIYTPDVTVFKTDESIPRLLPEEEWYDVDVITCAAPIANSQLLASPNYAEIIERRCEAILQCAMMNGTEVLILGAWGCGAFSNNPTVVAGAFKHLLSSSNPFKTVEFAIGSDHSRNYLVFKDTFDNR